MWTTQLIALLAAQYSAVVIAHPAPAPVPAPLPAVCAAGTQSPAFYPRSAKATTSTPVRARADAPAPAQYTANPSLGGGGSTFVDSAHFRVYNGGSNAAASLKHLEAAHACFVEKLGWRTPGLSINTGGKGQEVGPWYKLNVYGMQDSELNGAAGVQQSDGAKGLAWLEVLTEYLADPRVVVHEYGHSMHYSEEKWVGQQNTGAWWEPMANYIADTYWSTPICNDARKAVGLPGVEGDSFIALQKVISDSYQVIVDGTVDTGNYYESYPFLSYLTFNPDNTTALGPSALLTMIRTYVADSNDTPLHVLARLLPATTSLQHLIGRYWARMAYVDIAHPKAHAAFLAQRSTLVYGNIARSSGSTYAVVPARAPRYMGANINPLKITAGASSVSVAVTADAAYSATLVVSSKAGVSYTDVVQGKASAAVAQGDEVSFVIANTPAQLVKYDPFDIPAALNKGLGYSVVVTGATA
ncbi:hypothetical protein P153DRAFT_295362 [Dothidotthia symphoricarpi CBS 119687]|uniref:Dockerin type 1 n=1 Tax=Dothidotthia symphoricarpi CBS 119687 TaxID=1392245 RepID=A0A6A6A8U1_9PLEO|nr:uncharacterized protein P153DRAFT_295362 [Dothidotthia symphoricarpi CBS 119687]KAF2127237.1 hypothetical protein P153DRAFT_295362 [Dothidotthia symphoricarpi CBS 119687]